MKKIILSIVVSVLLNVVFAQENLPTDYLSKEFHKGRRDEFRKLMPANSVAVIFAYPERTFSRDVSYQYHPNPDLYYLSGYKESNAVLLIFKESQQANNLQYNEVIFVRDRDKLAETWTGRRLGIEGTKEKLGFSVVYTTKEFNNFPINFNNFTTVLFADIPTDIKNDNSGYDLAGLLKTFRDKTAISDEDRTLHNLQQRLASIANMQNLEQMIVSIKRTAANNEKILNDSYIQQIMAKPDSLQLETFKLKLLLQKDGMDLYREIITGLRQIKTAEEMVVFRKAIKISAIAHTEAMKAVTANMSENEVDGIHRYIHRKYGAEDEGYPTIVGAGANGCILHYGENNNTKIDNQLLLMDVGAEYHGYSADITRTVPANGKFTPEQRAIYELVYEAQEAVFKLCQEGTPFGNLNKRSTEILADGLLKLGIIKDKNEVRTYYPHGCSHYLGLDVHDTGDNLLLKENMVITVEPGIYIPAGSNCDKKWWNIGVRIEDDVLIGKNNFEILSIDAVRKWDDVEKVTREKSRLNDINLQKL
jgi:Xaa-Pro aminopeptidase